jgi:hypothetical protein
MALFFRKSGHIKQKFVVQAIEVNVFFIDMYQVDNL